LALECAQRLNDGKEPSKCTLLYLNGARDNSISVVRKIIKSFATIASLTATTTKVKLVLLDEADHLSEPFQMAMRCIIEQCSSNVRFCFTVNHLSSLIPAIQSRCRPFCIPSLSDDCIATSLAVTDSSISSDAIVYMADGDLRAAGNLSMLSEAASALSLTTTTDAKKSISIFHLSGFPSVAEIQWLLQLCCIAVSDVVGKKTPTLLRDTLQMIEPWYINTGLMLESVVTGVSKYVGRNIVQLCELNNNNLFMVAKVLKACAFFHQRCTKKMTASNCQSRLQLHAFIASLYMSTM
jgi:DNA polymerase III delta prime subunit